MAELISTRIDSSIEKEIEKIAQERQISRSVLLREAIVKGLAELKLEYSLELYKKGKVTTWKAAHLADLPLWEFMDAIKKRKIPSQYSIEDAKEDIKQVFGK